MFRRHRTYTFLGGRNLTVSVECDSVDEARFRLASVCGDLHPTAVAGARSIVEDGDEPCELCGEECECKWSTC